MNLDLETELELVNPTELKLHLSNFDSFSSIAKNSLDQLENCIELIEDVNKDKIIHEMQTAKKCIEYKSVIFEYITKLFERITMELSNLRREIDLTDQEGATYQDWLDEFHEFATDPTEFIEVEREQPTDDAPPIAKRTTTQDLHEDAEPAKPLRAIDPQDWHAAWWTGVSFGVDPTGEQPPFLGIHFRSELLGRQIFESMISSLGNEDEFDAICVAILEGEIPDCGEGYSVTIANNCSGRKKKFNALKNFNQPGEASILNVATDGPSDMLTRFKAAYEHFGEYLLVPMFGADTQPPPELDLAILKHDLILRDTNDLQSWEA